MSRSNLAAEHILEVLNHWKVEYLVIGAFAAIAQGAPLLATFDVDLTPRRSVENLERLSNALGELDARIRVAELEEGLVFAHDAESLSRMEMLNLTCEAGDFDLVFAPSAAPAGYDDLVGHSVVIHVGSVEARAASLEDVLRSKEEAGREKDLRSLAILKRYLSERGSPPAGQ